MFTQITSNIEFRFNICILIRVTQTRQFLIIIVILVQQNSYLPVPVHLIILCMNQSISQAGRAILVAI